MQIMAKEFLTEFTKWRLVDSHWRCVHRKVVQGATEKECTEYCGTLADYLWMLGFDIPECIQYCLASNNKHKIKYRVFGGSIEIYCQPAHLDFEQE